MFTVKSERNRRCMLNWLITGLLSIIRKIVIFMLLGVYIELFLGVLYMSHIVASTLTWFLHSASFVLLCVYTSRTHFFFLVSIGPVLSL